MDLSAVPNVESRDKAQGVVSIWGIVVWWLGAWLWVDICQLAPERLLYNELAPCPCSYQLSCLRWASLAPQADLPYKEKPIRSGARTRKRSSSREELNQRPSETARKTVNSKWGLNTPRLCSSLSPNAIRSSLLFWCCHQFVKIQNFSQVNLKIWLALIKHFMNPECPSSC